MTIIRNLIVGIAFGSISSCCSAMSSLTTDQCVDNKGTTVRTVTFVNPCYPQYSQQQDIQIPNGSMLNFAAAGPVGKAIRAASAMNEVPNPLGLTHSGVIVNEDPKYLYDLIQQFTPGADNPRVKGRLTAASGYAMLRELMDVHYEFVSATHAPKTTAAFSLESDGSANEVLRGIMPHVHLHDLGLRLNQYDGNVYMRQINKPISIEYSRSFLDEYLGKPYESVTDLKELLRSTRDGNDVEGADRVFCSELAGYFYKGANIIPSTENASNMIPEYFGSTAGSRDLLSSVAGKEITLKRRYDFSQRNLDGTSCFGHLVKRLLRHF